jgi:hypothetical protein
MRRKENGAGSINARIPLPERIAVDESRCRPATNNITPTTIH